MPNPIQAEHDITNEMFMRINDIVVIMLTSSQGYKPLVRFIDLN